MNKKNPKFLGELLTALEFEKLREMAQAANYSVEKLGVLTKIDGYLFQSLKESRIEHEMREKQARASLEVDRQTKALAEYDNILMKIRHATTKQN